MVYINIKTKTMNCKILDTKKMVLISPLFCNEMAAQKRRPSIDVKAMKSCTGFSGRKLTVMVPSFRTDR